MRHVLLIQLPGPLLLIGLLLSSCDNQKCGCAPPPRPPVTVAALTSVAPWWLQEVTQGGQTTYDTHIKDRYSLRLRLDGTYTQTLLSDDSTAYNGTWLLMGAENRTLHLTDHKGAAQEYTVGDVSDKALYLYRPDKNGQPESYLFKATR